VVALVRIILTTVVADTANNRRMEIPVRVVVSGLGLKQATQVTDRLHTGTQVQVPAMVVLPMVNSPVPVTAVTSRHPATVNRVLVMAAISLVPVMAVTNRAHPEATNRRMNTIYPGITLDNSTTQVVDMAVTPRGRLLVTMVIPVMVTPLPVTGVTIIVTEAIKSPEDFPTP